jgi:hypothetical protein
MTRTFVTTDAKGREIMVPTRRNAPRFGTRPIGVREFTKEANRTARRAKKAAFKRGMRAATGMDKKPAFTGSQRGA